MSMPRGAIYISKCKEIKYSLFFYTTSSTGFSPLHQACLLKNLKMVELLLSWKADVYCLDNKGNLPLHYAGQVRIFRLISYECVISAKFPPCLLSSNLHASALIWYAIFIGHTCMHVEKTVTTGCGRMWYPAKLSPLCSCESFSPVGTASRYFSKLQLTTVANI